MLYLRDLLESRPQDYELRWERQEKMMVMMKTDVLSIAHTLVISGISCFSNDLHFKKLKYVLCLAKWLSTDIVALKVIA